MHIGREDQKESLSYVEFNRICNVISLFSELNLDILKEGITFPISYVSISCKWRKQSY